VPELSSRERQLCCGFVEAGPPGAARENRFFHLKKFKEASLKLPEENRRTTKTSREKEKWAFYRGCKLKKKVLK